MKNLLATGLLLFAIHLSSIAQNNPVAKTTFAAQVTKLNTAIDQKVLANQNSALNSLITLMNTQLTYLKATRASLGTVQGKQQQQTIDNDIQIENYVKGFLPATKIISDKTNLINQLNLFAATCQ